MKTPHIILIAMAALLTSCSSSTYRVQPDGSVTYHAGGLLDKSDWDVHAMLGTAQGEATISRQVPILDGKGQIVALAPMTLTFPAGSVFRITEGGDRTEVAKEVSRAFFAWKSLDSWTSADVAKNADAEKTARTAITETETTNRAAIGATERSIPAVVNPEANAAGAGILGGLFRR